MALPAGNVVMLAIVLAALLVPLPAGRRKEQAAAVTEPSSPSVELFFAFMVIHLVGQVLQERLDTALERILGPRQSTDGARPGTFGPIGTCWEVVG
jgi:hypothetical protein